MQSLPKFDLVLFGGTGDLAMRKLLPALYRRSCAGQIDSASRIIGAARSQLSREEYLEQVRATCETHVGSLRYVEMGQVRRAVAVRARRRTVRG
jgi:glucose-6-phosphate 1-dehydrogenase